MSRRTFRFPDGIKTASDTARLEFMANVIRGWNGGCEVIYERTSQMSQKEMGELIEWATAFG